MKAVNSTFMSPTISPLQDSISASSRIVPDIRQRIHPRSFFDESGSSFVLSKTGVHTEGSLNGLISKAL